MHLVPRSQAYVLVVDLPARPDAAPTFVVYDANGASVQTGTSTLDSVDTTLASSGAPAATALTLTSGTGVVAGRRYLVGGTEELGGEQVTVRAVSGAAITLLRPLSRAASAGATFESTRVGVALSAIETIGRHYRVEFAWDVATVAQPPFVVPFDVVRYTPRTLLTFEELRDLDPLLAKRFPAGGWFPALRERAWSMILHAVASKVAPGALMGAIDLTIPHGYLVRALLAENAGVDFEPLRAQLMGRYTYELETALAATAIDNDQDGRVESNEGWYRSVPVLRG
jgi:hypothetical protein